MSSRGPQARGIPGLFAQAAFRVGTPRVADGMPAATAADVMRYLEEVSVREGDVRRGRKKK